MGFMIESGVPLPKRRESRNDLMMALSMMKIGDSLAMEKQARPFSVAISNIQRALPGKKFTTRTVVENGEKKTRVWRTA